MTRSHALIPCSILEDDRYRALSPDAQWLYITLRLQPDLNMAGMLPLTQTRWARLSAGAEVDTINRALDELVSVGLILTDFCTQEVGIVGFIGAGPGGMRDNWMRAALRALAASASPALVAGLVEDLPGEILSALRRAFEAMPGGTLGPTLGPTLGWTLGPTPDVSVSAPVRDNLSKQRAQHSCADTAMDREDEGAGGDHWPEGSLVHESLIVLARRDLAGAKARGIIKDDDAYFRKCLNGRLLRDRALVATLAAEHPDWPPTRLANAADPPETVTPPPYVPEGIGHGWAAR